MNIKETKKGIELVMEDLKQELETAVKEEYKYFHFGMVLIPIGDYDGDDIEIISLRMYHCDRNSNPMPVKEYSYSSNNSWKRELK